MFDEFVYVLKSGPYYKIGRTTDVTKRIAQVALLMPFEVELFKVINTNNCAVLEAKFHELYSLWRRNGEWFELDDRSVAQLLLFPPSFDVTCSVNQHFAKIRELNTLAWKHIEARIEEYRLEDEIDQRAETEKWVTGADIGGALLPTDLEAECPYDLDEDNDASISPFRDDPPDWIVADNT